MSFDWNHYLQLAETLFEQIQAQAQEEDSPFLSLDSEAVHRTIVSRAYYAAFCLARNQATENDGYSVRGPAHQDLQKHFTDSRHDSTRRAIGNQLKRLHQDRIKADYQEDLPENSYNIASKALAQARRILSNLEKI